MYDSNMILQYLVDTDATKMNKIHLRAELFIQAQPVYSEVT